MPLHGSRSRQHSAIPHTQQQQHSRWPTFVRSTQQLYQFISMRPDSFITLYNTFPNSFRIDRVRAHARSRVCDSLRDGRARARTFDLNFACVRELYSLANTHMRAHTHTHTRTRNVHDICIYIHREQRTCTAH